MKILDKPRPDSADTQAATDGHLQEEEAFKAAADFRPLGKDPKRAFLLSLVPGVGHLYIGQIWSGLVFLTATVMSWIVVATACCGGTVMAACEKLAASMNLPFNTAFGHQLGGVSLAHPAVLTFVFLYLCYVLYVGQDAYLFAARSNNPLYPPSKGIRFAPVFGGSYLVHCAVMLVILASAFLVASKQPDEQTIVIDMELQPPPPPPKEEPIPEPPKPKTQPKSEPKPEQPKPVEKVAAKPTPKPIITPPVVQDTPLPVTDNPVAPSAPQQDTATGTGKGEPSAASSGEPSDGGGGDGDEADFGAYLSDMEKRIRKNWFPPRGNENAKIIVAFKLNSQGKVSSVRLKTSSGLMIADTAATDAIKNAGPFGNLPKGAPDKVDIVFTFDYTVFNGGKATIK
jgi:TonB family protein